MAALPEDVQATFCATLVDEWVRGGVEHAVVAPGSRSTPLALSLAAEGHLRVHVHHDERSAGFLALGLAIGTHRPVLVLTTSGTAAVELHPAVVEADLARVPLLVCTADRPPELFDVGAPQAIDQTRLYGRSVRWFHDVGVADAAAAPGWRALAARALAETSSSGGGPVHLNLPFREPLLGTAGTIPAGRPAGRPWAQRRPTRAADGLPLVELAGRRGVIVAGAGSGRGPELGAVALALGWPVIAAPQAEVWSTGRAVVVAAPDALLRVPSVLDHLRPDVVLRLGGGVASRIVSEEVSSWCRADEANRAGPHDVVVCGPGRWTDPCGTADEVIQCDPAELVTAWTQQLDGVEPVLDGEWARRWRELSALAAEAIDESLAAEVGLTEPAVARQLVAALPDGSRLVLSSSMPIRDVEWYVNPTVALDVHANRGANGIDGVVSTAVGLAVSAPERATALLMGDVAFLHDVNGLLGAAGRGVDLVIVVVDNDGGGIFSFLPQAEVVDVDRFELLYGTPHGLDLVAVAAAHGAQARSVTDVGPAVKGALGAGGVHVLVVRSDRAANVATHRRLNDAVAAAVTATTVADPD